jgi:hypothetical protein
MNILNWQKLKKQTDLVAKKFKKFHRERTKITACGKFVTTSVYQNVLTNEFKSKQQNDKFCKSKFCYVCEKIKSQKYQYGLKEVLEKAVLNGNYIDFLTLTVENCNIDDLSNSLNQFSKDFKKFRDNLTKNYGMIGFFKSVEITYTNKIYLDDNNKNVYTDYETKFDFRNKKEYVEVPKEKDGKKQAHPHYHLLIVYKEDDRTKNPDFNLYKNLWKNISGGSIFVKKFRTENLEKSIKEITKYMTKESDYNHFTEDEMNIIYKNLARKRFYAKGGNLSFDIEEVKKKIDLDNRKEQYELDNKSKWELVVQLKYRFVSQSYLLFNEVWEKDFSEIQKLLLKKFLVDERNYQKGLYEKELYEYSQKMVV